jgi:hypothetical protein
MRTASVPAVNLSPVGSSFLKPGDSAIHFYYSAAEQARFAPQLQEALERGLGVVLATAGDRHPLAGLRPPRFRRTNNFLRLQITANLAGAVASIAQAATALAQRLPEVRLLADFDGLVSSEAIFEVEAGLARQTRGLRLVTISQYDGNAFSATVTLEQFHSHALTVIGNIFYSENRNFTSPDQYARERLHAAQKIVARAAGKSA